MTLLRLSLAAILIGVALPAVAGVPGMDLPRLEFPEPSPTCKPPAKCEVPK